MKAGIIACGAMLASGFPSEALPGNGNYLFICTSGGFYERATDRTESALFAVSITFNIKDKTSEVLIGSRSNSVIGQREALHFDGLVRENEGTVTGFMQENTDTSEYWTLETDDDRALVSLDDIVIRAEDCVDMGASSEASRNTLTSDTEAERVGAAAARHFENLMSAQDRLLALPDELKQSVVVSASGLLSSKISEWAPGAIESRQIDRSELFYLIAVATNHLANFTAEAGLQAATSCHLRESQALMAAAKGAEPERVGCRSEAYRSLVANALRHAPQISTREIEESVNIWATNAVLLGLDAVKMDLQLANDREEPL